MGFKRLCCEEEQMSVLIYDSIPPQIQGKRTGQLSVRFPKLEENQKRLAGFTARFEWWGQKGQPICLAIPWKHGQRIDEVIFPIRVDRFSLEGYFSDMDQLRIEVVSSDNVSIGHASLSLAAVIRDNLIYRGLIPIILRKKADRGEIKLCIEFVTKFIEHDKFSQENSQVLPDAFQRIEVNSLPNLNLCLYSNRLLLVLIVKVIIQNGQMR